MRPQYLPPGFKLAEGTIPVEPVEGGWKWNGNLTIRDFNWSNPIFKGKPVVEVTGNFSIQYSGVTSLRGCPSKIGGSFLKGQWVCYSYLGEFLMSGQKFNFKFCDNNEAWHFRRPRKI